MMEENTFKKRLEKPIGKIVKMKNVDGFLKNVKQYLGTVDAIKEWNDNPEDAYKRFLHTQSYQDFIEEDALILLGRTGTGKTSILRCICENVNNQSITTYKMAIMVQFNEILDTIMTTIDDFNDPTINTQLVNIISMYTNCHIMKMLLNKHDINVNKVSKMKSYIKNNHLNDLGDYKYTHNGINKIYSMVKKSQDLSGKSGEIAKNVTTIMDIVAAFSQNGYEEAYQEMMGILKDNNVLVLIDTLDEYDLRDARLVLSIKALIATCFKYYNDVSVNHINIKISIPSEIHTHLIEKLPGKQQGNTVVIQWKNNDLIKMIAIRLLYFINHSKNTCISFGDSYKYDDFYDDNSKSVINAKKILYEILPQVCPTSLEYSFDTIAYCIRHTLKKPRELMTIFNYLLSKIMEEQNVKYFHENPDEIRNIVHSTQEEMISSALSMYTTSYMNINDTCEIILQNRHYYFQGKDLDDKLKEAVANNNGYDITDIKRILLESGLIGKINEISLINNKKDENDKCSNDESKVHYVKAKFEYQVKGRLSLNREDLYVLHPMCYEHFECSIDNMVLVYPDEFGDDAEIMKSVRLKHWD